LTRKEEPPSGGFFILSAGYNGGMDAPRLLTDPRLGMAFQVAAGLAVVVLSFPAFTPDWMLALPFVDPRPIWLFIGLMNIAAGMTTLILKRVNTANILIKLSITVAIALGVGAFFDKVSPLWAFVGGIACFGVFVWAVSRRNRLGDE